MQALLRLSLLTIFLGTSALLPAQTFYGYQWLGRHAIGLKIGLDKNPVIGITLNHRRWGVIADQDNLDWQLEVQKNLKGQFVKVIFGVNYLGLKKRDDTHIDLNRSNVGFGLGLFAFLQGDISQKLRDFMPGVEVDLYPGYFSRNWTFAANIGWYKVFNPRTNATLSAPFLSLGESGRFAGNPNPNLSHLQFGATLTGSPTKDWPNRFLIGTEWQFYRLILDPNPNNESWDGLRLNGNVRVATSFGG